MVKVEVKKGTPVIKAPANKYAVVAKVRHGKVTGWYDDAIELLKEQASQQLRHLGFKWEFGVPEIQHRKHSKWSHVVIPITVTEQ